MKKIVFAFMVLFSPVTALADCESDKATIIKSFEGTRILLDVYAKLYSDEIKESAILRKKNRQLKRKLLKAKK